MYVRERPENQLLDSRILYMSQRRLIVRVAKYVIGRSLSLEKGAHCWWAICG